MRNVSLRGVHTKTLTTAMIFAFIISTCAYAAPALTINSPQNTTYSAYGPIPINITSTEPVNFYAVKIKSGRKTLVAESASVYNRNVYGSRGTINLTIFANNSNGSATKSVVFTVNHSSVINVTTCGHLSSPNTTYVLQNDVSGSFCIVLEAKDATFDMNGFTVDAGEGAITGDCNSVTVKNGRITGGVGILLDGGTKCQLKNISMVTEDIGIIADFFSSSLLEKISIINATTAIEFDNSVTDIFMKNLTLATYKPSSAAFYVTSFDATFTLENSNVSGFTDNMIFSTNNVDWYFRNNVMDLTSVTGEIAGRVRMFKEHLLQINTTNTLGQRVSASVELIDNGVFARTNREANTYTFNSNPTGQIFVGTNENGSAEAYITERLITVTTDSPPTFTETVFSPYTLIARSALGIDVVTNQNVVLNSTLAVNFTVNTSTPCGNATSLPVCGINVMLDLDNDGTVDTKDAKVIQKVKVGHNVTVNGTKMCEAINFLPV